MKIFELVVTAIIGGIILISLASYLSAFYSLTTTLIITGIGFLVLNFIMDKIDGK